MGKINLGLSGLAALAILALFVPASIRAGDGPTDVQILGPVDVVPESQPVYSISWSGGVSPWTVRLEATDPVFQFEQEQVHVETSCQDSVCQSFPIFVNYSIPQISEITATVTDALGQVGVATPSRVRVGTDGPFYVRPQTTVFIRPDPKDPDRFLCLGNEADPPYMDVVKQDGATLLDVFSDENIPAPSNLVVAAQDLLTFDFTTVFGVADTDWANNTKPPPEGDAVLNFPLPYGDYSDPDITPWDNASVPSPALAELNRYTVRVPTPFECSDGSFTRFMEFYLNPADRGDFVFSTDLGSCNLPRRRGPFSDNCSTVNGLPFVGRFFPVEAEDELEVGRNKVIAACVSEQLVRNAVVLLTNMQFLRERELTEEELETLGVKVAVTILTNQTGLENIRAECRRRVDLTDLRGNSADLESSILVEAGAVRIEVVDPALSFTSVTQFASVTTVGTGIYDVVHVPDGRTLFNAGSNSITVVPVNQNLGEVVVPPRFSVSVDGDTISTPVLAPFLFADSFE